MPIARFEMPDGRVARFEVPEGTTPEQAQSMMAAQFATQDGAAAPQPVKLGKDAFPDALRQVLRDTDWGTRNIAAAGTSLSNLHEGIKQLLQGSELYNLATKGRAARSGDVKPSARAAETAIIRDEAPIGALLGDITVTAPTFAAGGPSIPMAAGIGATYGGLQPADTAGQRLAAASIGGGAGAGGQLVANKATGFVANKAAELAAKKAQNTVLDETLQKSIEAGYKVPPSMMPDSGLTSRLMEGASGKYKTNQLFGIKNQQLTNTLARRAVGLTDDAPLTSEAMQAIRSKAYSTGYEPVERFGRIKVDTKFIDDLDSIVSSRNRASNAFPGAIKDEIAPFIDSLKQSQQFDAGDALKAIQVFRNQANDAYILGNSDLGAAKKGAAKAIEDQIERALQVKADAKDAWQAIDEILGRRMSDADFGVMKKARSIAGNLKTGKITQDEALSNLTMLTPKSKTANDALMVAHDMIANASNEQAYAQQLLSGFRNARKLMAKSHTIEDAIIEGGGKVNAIKLANRLQMGKPLSEELETIAKFANNFGDVARVPKSGNANPLTAMDFMVSTPSGILGTIAGGGPAGVAAAAALPSARIAARYGLLSPAVQKMISAPTYAVSPAVRMGGGLLGYAPVGATVLGLEAFGQ